MISRKEVLNALITIRNVCKETEDCQSCLLRNSAGMCGVIEDSNGETYGSLTEWFLPEGERLILN